MLLQVPMEKKLRDEATKAALEMGFSSLQELIRIILYETAKGNVSLSISFKKPIELREFSK